MKARLAILSSLLIASVAGAVLTYPKPVKGDFDLQGLNQQVQNHEARITNTENDVKQLQQSTNTAPSTVRVEVPAPPSVTAAPAPTSTPVSAPAPVDPPSISNNVPVSSSPVMMSEIIATLATVAPPGEQRDAKIVACQNLFQAHNVSDVPPQYPNTHICSYSGLEGYSTF